MPKRCGNEECEKLVNESRPSTVRLQDKVFCGRPCMQQWLHDHHFSIVEPATQLVTVHTHRRMNGG